MHYGINRSVKIKRKVLTRYLLFHLLKAHLARDLYSLSLDAIPVSLEVVRPHEQLTAKLAFVGGREMVFTVFTESRWISKTLWRDRAFFSVNLFSQKSHLCGLTLSCTARMLLFNDDVCENWQPQASHVHFLAPVCTRCPSIEWAVTETSLSMSTSTNGDWISSPFK